MAKFRCSNCNYVFEPQVKERMPGRCPYCSNRGTLEEEKYALEDEGIEKVG